MACALRSCHCSDVTCRCTKLLADKILEGTCRQLHKEVTEGQHEGAKHVTNFPEEPTTCCMSGCANCVWLDYAEQLSAYYKDGGEKALKEIEEKISDPNIKCFIMQEIRMKLKTNANS